MPKGALNQISRIRAISVLGARLSEFRWLPAVHGVSPNGSPYFLTQSGREMRGNIGAKTVSSFGARLVRQI
jgi:hypothetical protein